MSIPVAKTARDDARCSTKENVLLALATTSSWTLLALANKDKLART